MQLILELLPDLHQFLHLNKKKQLLSELFSLKKSL